VKTPPKPSPPEIAGDSPAADALRAKIAAAAGADTVVLFSGPVGSGRTLGARCLHELSARADGPFVVVPCGALSPTLAESELFGHEKGAFTGAVARHTGLVERASGGVVMLAEAAELPSAVQPKLLRFLEEKTVTPLGGEARPVDVRVLGSTGTDLAAEVRAGRFREDLYYRLRVLKVDVPPLAERGGDVLVLADRFLGRLAREFGKERPELSEGARAALLRHPWPGNVRELLNCLRGAMVFAGGGELGREDLGLEAPASAKAAGTLKAVVARVVKETEKRLIEEALARSGGNRTKAAKELGLSRRGLQIKMKRYGVS